MFIAHCHKVWEFFFFCVFDGSVWVVLHANVSNVLSLLHVEIMDVASCSPLLKCFFLSPDDSQFYISTWLMIYLLFLECLFMFCCYLKPTHLFPRNKSGIYLLLLLYIMIVLPTGTWIVNMRHSVKNTQSSFLWITG